MIEDLEVEGYFASRSLPESQVQNSLYKSVRVITLEQITDLALPLQGKDFLAGFETKGTKSHWLVFLNYSYLEVEGYQEKFQRTDLSFSLLIATHLINMLIRIKLLGQGQELSGYLIGANKHFLDLITTSGTHLKIPIQSVSALAVEKLSIKDKL
jgi:hypothetical protein